MATVSAGLRYSFEGRSGGILLVSGQAYPCEWGDGQVTGCLPECLVVPPHERKCPYFNGKSGISVNDWIEEAQAWDRYLFASDQVLFLFDHLAGEAREERRYHPSIDRGDPGKIISI